MGGGVPLGSMKKMKYFEKIDKNHYEYVGNTSFVKYWAKGERIDMNDLAAFSTTNGPYIYLGYKIGGREVIHIEATSENIYVEVEHDV